jgi:hypothetical protein
MIVPQAKKLKKEEVRDDFVTRNQNKSTSIEHPCISIRISSNAGNQNGFVLAAIVPLGRGEGAARPKNCVPAGRKIWENVR